MSTGKHRLAPKHAQHLINVHVGEIQYIYVRACYGKYRRKGRREGDTVQGCKKMFLDGGVDRVDIP